MRNLMSIIKIEVSIPEAVTALKRFKNDRIKALEELSNAYKIAVENCLNDLLNTEMALFLGRPDQSENKRNGYKERYYTFKGIGTLQVRMPQARNKGFESNVVPKHERIDPRLKEDIAVLHLAGLSTRTIAMVSKRLLDVTVSKDTVTESLSQVSERACEWLRRPLNDDYWALSTKIAPSTCAAPVIIFLM